jgi:inhibitor of KinA sporulation pathway (predicted exonuclease)
MFASDCRMHRLEVDWTEHHVNLKEHYRLMKRMSRSPGLKKVIEMEDILFTGQHHRAISDAENLTKLFLKHLGSWSF